MQMVQEILNKQRNLIEEAKERNKSEVLVNQYQNIHFKIVQSQKELDYLANEIAKAEKVLSETQQSNNKEKSIIVSQLELLNNKRDLLLNEIGNLEITFKIKSNDIKQLNLEKKVYEDSLRDVVARKQEMTEYSARIIIENIKLIDNLKNKLCDLQINQNILLSENDSLSKQIDLKKKELSDSNNKLNEWKLLSDGYSDQLRKIQKKEKEVNEIYSEVATMHERMKPEYIKEFKKFSNLN
jgi:hypothetical protein